MTIVDEIEALFAQKGHQEYVGEAVNQLEHALQSAQLAQRAGASAELICAALLHDLGHLLDPLTEDPTLLQRDLVHEATAARFLSPAFPPSVTRPIELHVAAKRYLCATDSDYHNRLSSASLASLDLQGGPMSIREIERFEADPFASDAVQLRLWDDQAKVVGLPTPQFQHFRPLLEEILKRSCW